jgi:dTDP-4-dehydrorhamnose reductase
MQVPRVVIIGASGVIGSALMQATRRARLSTVGTALSRPRDGLVGFDMGAVPLCTVIPDLGINDVVYLLAGYISPSWIFANPEAAHRLNLDCTKRIVDEVAASGARLIFMSTDQVFDGVAGGYVETSATRPLNLYGHLKAAVEEHVLAVERNVVARTGWVVGWEPGQHCAVTQCYETLLKPGARMASDNFINVTGVDDIARGLCALAERPPAHRIYHLVSAPEVSRAELAALVKASSGWGPDMDFATVPFATIAYSEPRPTRAFLRSERLRDLNVVFRPSHDVIRRKALVLDEWRAASLSDLPSMKRPTGRADGFSETSLTDNMLR